MRSMPVIVGSRNKIYIAWVDDEDFDLVDKFTWSIFEGKNGTLYARCTSTKIYMHRLLLDAKGDEEVDHIDGDGLNNRRNNIRLASKDQNNRNRKKLDGCSSQYKGVCWKSNRWEVTVAMKYIGRFLCEIEAAKAYDVAAVKAFGEFARLNFPI